MRYAGWYPRRRGILEHLDSGKISLLDAAVHDFVCLIADHRTGVAWISAEKIHALAGAGISLRAIQRSLAHLEEIAWIKRFRTRGQRGNYPVVIAKFHVISVTDNVTDASPKWMSVNIERTSDWRDVQFDPVTDASLADVLRRHRGVTERGTDASPVQEERSNNQEPRTAGVRRTSGGDSPGLKVENRKEMLRRGLVKKICETDESLNGFLDSNKRDCGERYPEWWGEVLEACRFVGFKIDEADPTVTLSFVETLTTQFEKYQEAIRNRQMLPGIFSTKCVDELVRNRKPFPPAFVEHRDRLRKQERNTRSA